MGPLKKGLSKYYILRAVEDSLKRLQTDHIDLYQSHKDDPNTPSEETREAYSQLIREGKVRAVGASNYTAERFSESIEISRKQGYPSYESLHLEQLSDLIEATKLELEPSALEHLIKTRDTKRP